MKWGHLRVAPLFMVLYNGEQEMFRFFIKVLPLSIKFWKSLLCITVVAAFVSLSSEKSIKIYSTFVDYFHKNDFVLEYISSWSTVVVVI